MARSGVTEERIREAIQELDAEGAAVSVQGVRAKLGTGSFTTIQAALDRYRRERTDEVAPAVPEVPAKVSGAGRLVWAEAWKAASDAHEAERRAFETERERFAADKAQMAAEITRLEGELGEAVGAAETLTGRAAVAEAALHETKLLLARETTGREAAEADGERLRDECQNFRQDVSRWTERATDAERELAGRAAEVTRLREELTAARTVADEAEGRVRALTDERQGAVITLAQEESRRAAAEAEAGRLREELQAVHQQMTAWVERATRAETRLEHREAKGGKDGR